MSKTPTTFRSSLPAPSGSYRRVDPVAGDSDAARHLASAIQTNDPLKYKNGTSSTTTPPTAPPARMLGLPRPSIGPRRSVSNLKQRAMTPGQDETSPPALPGTSRSTLRLSSTTSKRAAPSAAASDAFQAPTISSNARLRRAAGEPRRGTELEIGDAVGIDSKDLRGVLRYLGPVKAKPGGTYAGIELVEPYLGCGKNDGTVAGEQLFATSPNNGVFSIATSVYALSDETPTDATARPESAMSNHSARGSDVLARPPSATPGKRRSSVLPRPQSRTSERSASSLSNRSSSRLRSHASAANGGPAESGPRAGSRAQQLSTTPAPPTTPPSSRFTKGRPSSPLKDTLLSRSTTLGSAPVDGDNAYSGLRVRQSFGLPTPRAVKGRLTAAAQPNMPPPSSPTKTGERSAEATASRPSSVASNRSQSGDEEREGAVPTSERKAKDRNRMLLEAMDLTPRRPSLSSGGVAAQATDSYGQALSLDSGLESHIAEPAVSFTEYETVREEAERLAAELERMRLGSSSEVQSDDLATALQARKEAEELLVIERRDVSRLREEKVKLEKESSELLETERKDTSRLREERIKQDKELSETKKNLESALADLAQAKTEAEKTQKDHEARTRDLEGKLAETETMAASLKDAISKSEVAEAQRSDHDAQLAAKDAEITQLNSRVTRLEGEIELEKGEADKLRQAGLDTIKYFEETIASGKQEVFEAEEEIADLRSQLEEARAIPAVQSPQQATTAAEIDNANLRDELAHAQAKLAAYDDQLAEAAHLIDSERETSTRRKDRATEMESKLNAKVEKLKAEVQRLEKSEAELTSRAEELHEALLESKAAVESERAEIETLRADLDNVEQLGGVGGLDTDARLEEAARRAEADKTRLETEISRLTSLLEGSRSGKREASKQADAARQEVSDREAEIATLKSKIAAAEAQKGDLVRQAESRTSADDEEHSSVVRGLRRALEERTHELEMLRRSSQPLPEQLQRARDAHLRELAGRDEELRHLRNNLESARHSARSSTSPPTVTSSLFAKTHSSPSPSVASPRSNTGEADMGYFVPDNSKRLSVTSVSSRLSRSSLISSHSPRPDDVGKEISGLNYLVKSLQEENGKVKHQSRVLELDLSARAAEAEKKARALELTVQTLSARMVSLQGDGANGDTGSSGGSAADVAAAAAHTASLEQQIKSLLDDTERMRTDMAKLQSKTAQQVALLQAEVANLESLIETRTRQINELDTRVDAYRRRAHSAEAKVESLKSAPSSDGRAEGDQPSETANAPSSAPASGAAGKPTDPASEWCDDCEEYGHRLEDCPALDNLF